ncbi:MAG: hypothetical protein AB7F35_00575 [Acetobacteraceae bacterium]
MNPIFDERPVYILGGGASLRDFDWSRLYRRQCIAVNTAFRMVPWANVLFFSDNRFFELHRDPGGQHFWRFKGEHILTTAPACRDMTGRIQYIDPATLTAKVGRRKFCAEACNSGVQAIILARQLGARQIVLLGFDNVPGHWHDGTHLAHPRRTAPEAYRRYGKDMERLAKLGLPILNANPSSALTGFPVIPRKDAF